MTRHGLLTRGSAITPGVPIWMTFCTNLMQHTRTPAAAVSHRRNIFDLMAAIFSQADVSPELLILKVGWASKKLLSEFTTPNKVQGILQILPRLRSTGRGKGCLHVHMPKHQRIDTRSSLYHALHDARVFPGNF